MLSLFILESSTCGIGLDHECKPVRKSQLDLLKNSQVYFDEYMPPSDLRKLANGNDGWQTPICCTCTCMAAQGHTPEFDIDHSSNRAHASQVSNRAAGKKELRPKDCISFPMI